jgi:hypothetical protein
MRASSVHSAVEKTEREIETQREWERQRETVSQTDIERERERRLSDS